MNESDYKIRNLETSIAYLQEEHAKTLKLLHEEIKMLQMKNSELSFELVMRDANHGTIINNVEKEDIQKLTMKEELENLLKKLGELERDMKIRQEQLNNQKCENKSLRDKLRQMNEQNEQQLKIMEIELGKKSTKIVELTADLLTMKHRIEHGDHNCFKEESDTTSPSISQHPMKLRNQFSFQHTDLSSRKRPIISKQTLVSASIPVKTTPSTQKPHTTEMVIAQTDQIAFCRSIKRPNILPPITPTRNSPLLPTYSTTVSLLGDTATLSGSSKTLLKSQLQGNILNSNSTLINKNEENESNHQSILSNHHQSRDFKVIENLNQSKSLEIEIDQLAISNASNKHQTNTTQPGL